MKTDEPSWDLWLLVLEIIQSGILVALVWFWLGSCSDCRCNQVHAPAAIARVAPPITNAALHKVLWDGMESKVRNEVMEAVRKELLR